MTIYDWVMAYCETWEIRYTVFDCSSENVVYDSNNYNEFTSIIESEYADLEVLGFDIEVADGILHVEFNVDCDDDE